MSQQQKKEEKDIEFLKLRKKIELMEQVVSVKKAEILREQQIAQSKTDREYLSKYLRLGHYLCLHFYTNFLFD
jgi:hypothetical protein